MRKEINEKIMKNNVNNRLPSTHRSVETEDRTMVKRNLQYLDSYATIQKSFASYLSQNILITHA